MVLFPAKLARRIIGKHNGRTIMKTQYAVALSLATGVAIGAVAVQGLHAQAKLKSYSVVEVEPVGGATVPQSYLDTVRKAIVTAHGRALRTVNGQVFHVEGAPAPMKVGIVEWDSADDAKAFYKSKVWTDLASERDKAQKTIRRYIVEVEP
jgi:uncharacterized protein (DUF1330 family)